MGHMRSYSTLLSHILGSHPQISGYVEMHQDYKNRFDLLKLKIKIGVHLNEKKLNNFLLDKILHDHLALNPNILKRENVHIIFLIRNPEDTINSILNMSNYKTFLTWQHDISRVINYYIRRIQTIKNIATYTLNDAYFLEAENLIKYPEKTLSLLTKSFDLQTPLQKEYKIFKYTGFPRYGDSSPYILKGEIVKKNTEFIEDQSLSLDKYISDAYIEYNNCKAFLENKCKILR